MPSATTSFSDEEKLTLKVASGLDLFEDRPSQKKLWYWCRLGFRGHKLEWKREGNYILTSREAVARFLEAIQ